MLKELTPEKIKNCSRSELNVICDELRRIIYDTVTTCGGHLASNLGSVESTVALFYVFDFPHDKIVFDVGHQCYPYKLLSGRLDRFSTLRTAGGISGFPKRTESEFDCYDTGHAGTSVSAAIGLAKARDILGENHTVIAFCQNRRDKSPQSVGTPVVAADIHDTVNAFILHQSVAFRRQSGQIHIGIGKLGRDQLYASPVQHLCRVLGAEIRIDDVQVRNTDLLPFRCQVQRIVHGDIGLAAAVMAGK